jgi:vacuolar protein sorting-associated protein VTA1
MKTTSKFRLMASFIDVLASWGPIDDEMIKCKKYCQFKAVDIFKALKKGEVPKRGGPKEQDNQDAGLGNEIDELAKNMGGANLGNYNQNQ